MVVMSLDMATNSLFLLSGSVLRPGRWVPIGASVGGVFLMRGGSPHWVLGRWLGALWAPPLCGLLGHVRARIRGTPVQLKQVSANHRSASPHRRLRAFGGDGEQLAQHRSG